MSGHPDTDVAPRPRVRRSQPGRFWFKACAFAADDTLRFFGWNGRTLVATVGAFGFGAALHYTLRGPQPMREEVFLYAVYFLAPMGVFTVLLFLWNMTKAPAALYAMQGDLIADL